MGDIEYRAAAYKTSPQDQNANVNFKYTKPRTLIGVSYDKEKASPKDYKIKKTDLPGPGTHNEMEKAYAHTKPTCLTLAFKKDKRIGFAEKAAKNKALVPSPDRYDMKDVKFDKVYKRVTTRRH